jgi:multidrug efflux pump subunit AcrB
MTLGGLALAVGVLVDDSTVTIENTHRLLEEGSAFDAAVLEGANGIAVPTLISTLAICCVFVSVFFLQGAARYLFTPLAMGVVFAMLASYGISRTLTPIVIRLSLRREHANHGAAPGWLGRFHAVFNAGFDGFRNYYGWLLGGILRRRVLTPLVALSVVAGAVVMSLFVGSDFFPQVDAGLIQLHVRAPARTRVERTEQIFQAIEDNTSPGPRSRPGAGQHRPPATRLQSGFHRWLHDRGQ